MATESEAHVIREKFLLDRSIAIIKAGQAPSGAYVACPAYPTYNYAWFRDGTFTASAIERWGDHAGASRFFGWASAQIAARAAAVERCVSATKQGRAPAQEDLLHTRYGLDGRPGSEDWPNFQLDGFGTLLWGIEQHLRCNGRSFAEIAPDWQLAIRLLIRYLTALWQLPNHDCWEEFPDRIAVSTLAAIYAGLRAASALLGPEDGDSVLAHAAAGQIRSHVLEQGTMSGHLIKQIDGEDAVDASLLWACTPFGKHGLLSPRDPIMAATARRIESDLVGHGGGLHRYRADTFYGGGEWVLLTALLGQYYALSGDRTNALRCQVTVESHADDDGLLPEQWSTAVLAPEFVQEWVERWGPIAKPLLWSHAEYLNLRADLGV